LQEIKHRRDKDWPTYSKWLADQIAFEMEKLISDVLSTYAARTQYNSGVYENSP